MNFLAIGKFCGMLLTYPENESVFILLRSFIDQVKVVAEKEKLYSVKPSLRQRIAWMCSESAEMLLSSSCYDTTVNTQSKRMQYLQLRQIAESYVMESIHDVVFKYVKVANSDSIEKFSKSLEQLQGVSKVDLGIKVDCVNVDVSRAVAELKGLDSYRTPLEKAQCLKRTCGFITDALEFYRAAAVPTATDSTASDDGGIVSDLSLSCGGDSSVTTDDVLDQLIYVIVAAFPRSRSLIENIVYIKQYHFTNLLTSALGYNLANCQVAAQYILNKASESGKGKLSLTIGGGGLDITPSGALSEVDDSNGEATATAMGGDRGETMPLLDLVEEP
jgi:hypothetical protein